MAFSITLSFFVFFVISRASQVVMGTPSETQHDEHDTVLI